MDIQDVTLTAAERAAGMPSDATRQRAVDAFHRQGALVIHDAFDRTLIQGIHAAYMQQYGITDEAHVPETQAWKVGEHRWAVALDVAPPVIPLALWATSAVVPILTDLLGPSRLLSNFTALVSFPGATIQRVHRDHLYLFDEDRGVSAQTPPYAITLAVPLVDLTPDTGTTAMWCGSHRQPDFGSSGDADLPLTPYVPAGSAYMMDYRLAHTGLGNASAAPRPILYVVYSRVWFTDRQNFRTTEQIRISQRDYDAVPDDLKPMLGNVRPYASPLASV